MSHQLTFGRQQVFTSSRMQGYPMLGKLFNRLVGYTNVGNYARFTIFRQLMKQIRLPETPKILDLGAGYGEYSFSMAQAFEAGEIHALDIDHHRVSVIRNTVKKCGFSNVQVHGKYLEQLEESGFDFIYSVDVFEHILPEEMPFAAAIERLKPGGYLLVKIPNRKQSTLLPEAWFEEHHDWLEEEHIGQVYDLDGLKQRFTEEGFEVVFGSYSDGLLSRLAWELAYLGKKAGTITQLITLPVAKALIHLDRLFHNGKQGNAIQVIGKKPSI